MSAQPPWVGLKPIHHGYGSSTVAPYAGGRVHSIYSEWPLKPCPVGLRRASEYARMAGCLSSLHHIMLSGIWTINCLLHQQLSVFLRFRLDENLQLAHLHYTLIPNRCTFARGKWFWMFLRWWQCSKKVLMVHLLSVIDRLGCFAHLVKNGRIFRWELGPVGGEAIWISINYASTSLALWYRFFYLLPPTSFLLPQTPVTLLFSV